MILLTLTNYFFEYSKKHYEVPHKVFKIKRSVNKFWKILLGM
jgi:hypothetical protein